MPKDELVGVFQAFLKEPDRPFRKRSVRPFRERYAGQKSFVPGKRSLGSVWNFDVEG